MLVLISILVVAINYNSAENVLGIFHLPSKSHHILGDTIMNALAVRGHHVTMISPFSPNVGHNYEHIQLTGMKELLKDTHLMNMLIKENEMSFLDKLQVIDRQFGILDNFALNHTAVQSILSSSRTYDLVIVNYFGNEAFLGIANRFNAATVAFSPLGCSMFTNKLTGYSFPYSYVPNKFLPLSDNMNFRERFKSFIVGCMCYIYNELQHYSKQRNVLKNYFPNAPELQELMDNVSLVLLNSQLNTEAPRPYLPNMIQIGGFHIKENNELPKEYQSIMDSAKSGVILFSLGSNVKASDLPPQVLDDILSVIATLQQQVLWKFESVRNYTNFPNNLKVSNWLPQSSLLAHPNVKAFITHGGALSLTEAVYHGVPIVAIPLFSDQQSNVVEAVKNGYAVQVEFAQLSRKVFGDAIKEVLGNDRYLKNVKRASSIIRDQPIKPLDTAVYWIEHVMRHRGAEHFKYAATNQTWYQYYLLDVLCCITFLLIMVIVGLRRLRKKCRTINLWREWRQRNSPED